MQTHHADSTETRLTASDRAVTASQISTAYSEALNALVGVGKATTAFVEACINAGNLLKAKCAEEKKTGNWLQWLEANCPEISQPTAFRLIRIADRYSHRNNTQLPERLGSVKALYEALKETAEEGDAPPETKKEEAPMVPRVANFWKSIWRVVRGKDTPEHEKQAFVLNTAEAVTECKKNGWDLPVIEIEVEEIRALEKKR